MVKKMSQVVRSKAGRVRKRRRKLEILEEEEVLDEEERILRAATIHLIRHHGGLLVATGLRETQLKRSRLWIITVTLRYPTGHEGYVGDLLYDGKDFTFLTPPEVVTERVRQIEADPALQREWDEYRASTLSATET